MAWRRSSRLATSTAAVSPNDTAGLRRLISEERRLASEEASSMVQRLSQADRLRSQRVLAVRHSACLVTAICATLPVRRTAEKARQQALLSSPLNAELCADEDALNEARLQDIGALLARWRRRLARGDSGRVEAVQQQQAQQLQQLGQQQQQLEQEIYQSVAAVACDTEEDVPAGVPTSWQWLSLLDAVTQNEVSDNCAVVDCAYMQRLASVWARHGFCGGPHDFSIPRLAGFLATVQFCPEDVMTCWSHVEDIYPPSTVGREELMSDLMGRLRPVVLQRSLAAARARRRRWSAALVAHTAVVSDWRLQKEVLGHELEVQVLTSLQKHCDREQAQRQRLETQQRGEELRRRVEEWRRQATTAARQREEDAAREEAEARRLTEAETQRQATRRNLVKRRVAVFKERRRQQEQERQQAEERRREDAARRQQAEAEHHQRRVQLREELREQRLQQQQRLQEEVAGEQVQREQRLEAIRAEVRPEAERNPARLLADTQTSWARRGGEQPEQPQADAANHSFWDSQLHQDRRTRLEARLREAGLLDTGYARDVLKSLVAEVKPHLRPTHSWTAGEHDN